MMLDYLSEAHAFATGFPVEPRLALVLKLNTLCFHFLGVVSMPNATVLAFQEGKQSSSNGRKGRKFP